MKSRLNTSPVESNIGSSQEVKIKATAKAFNILSSMIYSDKITAVIRELCCNAYDAHVAYDVHYGTSRKDEPFVVHLPNDMEPWFEVRDFGIGLDHDGIINLYTTYFGSDKEESDDFTGTFGVGSKSPFAYKECEVFTVEATRGFYTLSYAVFLGDNGVPNVILVDEFVADFESGLAVRIPVNKYDFAEFERKALRVLRWFKTTPHVIGGVGYDLQVKPPEKYIDGDGYFLTDKKHGRAVAMMGNVAYPISTYNIDGEEVVGDILSLPVVMEFDTGELSVAVSREELSYDAETIDAIVKKAHHVAKDIGSKVQEKFDACENRWEASKMYSQMMTVYNPVSSVICSTRLLGKMNLTYNGHPVGNRIDVKRPASQDNFYKFVPPSAAIRKTYPMLRKTLNRAFFKDENDQMIARDGYPVEDTASSTITISAVPANDGVLIIDDLKTGGFSRAKTHINQESIRCATFWSHPYAGQTSPERKKKYTEDVNALLKDFEGINYVFASQLEKPEKKKRDVKPIDSVLLFDTTFKDTPRHGSVHWKKDDDPFSKAKYYVYLRGMVLKSDSKTDECLLFPDLFNLAKEAGLVADEEVMGVRHIDKDKVDVSEMTPFFDYLKDEVQNSKKFERDAYLAARADALRDGSYFLQNIARNGSVSFDLSRALSTQGLAHGSLAQKAMRAVSKKASIYTYTELARRLNVSLSSIEDGTKEGDQLASEFNEVYPMLDYLSIHKRGSFEAALEYINDIFKKENI